MSMQHDPLATKVQKVTETLNRRRPDHTETSKEIIRERNAFFDRLALLNAGALTFSVTLYQKNPKGLWPLHTAWICLLVALAVCLLRNFSHQYYRSFFAFASRAKAEVNFSDVDYEVISTQDIVYSDSSEPFDRQRAVKINRENRAKWEKSQTEMTARRNRHWNLVRTAEWIAIVSMTAGFSFLVIFATVNTR
jgi:hypothetical protein